MNTISNGLVDSLKTLGLTEYEAKVYAALVLFDRAEVKQIYEYLDAPKPSVYQSLRTLTDKGLVQVVSAKPAIYRATPPSIAIRHLAETHKRAEDSALTQLQEMEKSRAGGEYPNVLWTLFGDENVQHKMEELLGKTKRSLKLILPSEYLPYLALIGDKDVSVDLLVFGEASKAAAGGYGLRNLRVHDVLSIDFTDLAPLLKYFKDFPLPRDRMDKFILVAADDQEFMYIPPLPGPVRSGMTSANPFVLSLLNTVFNIFWDRTA